MTTFSIAHLPPLGTDPLWHVKCQRQPCSCHKNRCFFNCPSHRHNWLNEETHKIDCSTRVEGGSFPQPLEEEKNLPLAAWEMLQFTWIHSNSLFRAIISMFWPCNVATFTLWPCCLFLRLASGVVTQAQPGKADSYGATGPLPSVGRERLGKMHLLTYLKLIFLTLFWSFLCRRKGYSFFYFFPLSFAHWRKPFLLSAQPTLELTRMQRACTPRSVWNHIQ